MNKSIIGCTFLLLAITNLAISDEQIGILQIYDQFVISSAAASRCIKPDPEDFKNFMANFEMVTVRSGQELERRNPDKTKEQIASSIKERGTEITNRVFDLVKERGCEDKDVQQIVQRFYAQAKWQPSK